MADGLDEFYGLLNESANSGAEFSPRPLYNKALDFVVYIDRDVPSYAKRLNPAVTLILAAGDDSLIGFKIKGLRRILLRMQRLSERRKLVYSDDEIELWVVLQMALTAPTEDQSLDHYESDFQRFEGVSLDKKELSIV